MLDRIAKLAVPGLLTAITCFSAYSLADTIHYRWLNERGFTVYSDRPPPEGVNYEVVSSESNLKRMVDGDTGAVPLEVVPSASNEFQPSTKRPEDTSAEKARLCQRAKDNLDALSTGDVITIRDSNGEARQLSAQEIAIEKETARAQETVYCE
jgi:hypothetical protein